MEKASLLDGIENKEADWPENCLLVTVKRGAEEIIPRGKTRLQVGDVVVSMISEADQPRIHDYMEKLCRERPTG